MDKSVITYVVTTFELSEHDSLVVKPSWEGVEFSHLREGTSAHSLATYNTGRWTFKDNKNRSLFLQLMQTYPTQFRYAFKRYFYYRERDRFYTITCAKRKFTIWSHKIQNSIWDKMYNTFYGR